MTRHVAFLRGVSPLAVRMADLRHCFEDAGFEHVRTVLASGNVVFEAAAAEARVLEDRAERAMRSSLGRVFPAFVRRLDRRDGLVVDCRACWVERLGGCRMVSALCRSIRTPRLRHRSGSVLDRHNNCWGLAAPQTTLGDRTMRGR